MTDITHDLPITRQDLETLHNIRVDIRRLSSLLSAFLEIEEFGNEKVDDGVIRDMLEIIAGRVEHIFDDAEALFIRLSSGARGE